MEFWIGVGLMCWALQGMAKLALFMVKASYDADHRKQDGNV